MGVLGAHLAIDDGVDQNDPPRDFRTAIGRSLADISSLDSQFAHDGRAACNNIRIFDLNGSGNELCIVAFKILTKRLLAPHGPIREWYVYIDHVLVVER